MKTKLFFTFFLFTAFYTGSFGQCTNAYINWDNVNYLSTAGNYNTFVTPAMVATQRFAICNNALAIAVTGCTSNSDNGTHSGDLTGYTGSDVNFSGNGTITLTFDNVVSNVSFILYDVDVNQRVLFGAVNGSGVAQTIDLTLQGTTDMTLTGDNTTAAQANGGGSDRGTGSNRASVLATIAGPVKTITLTISNSGTSPEFYFSDIKADITTALPNDYHAVSRPFTGQPPYVIVTPDSNTVHMLNLNNGQASFLFQEPGARFVNAFGYDPYNKILYYCLDYSTSGTKYTSIKKYDFNTETISTVISDVRSAPLGIPLFDQGVESASGAFYNGSFYIGIEAANSTFTSGRESMVWRVDFDGSGNPTTASQVFGTPADDGFGTVSHDWGDMVIADGVLYNFDGGDISTCNYRNVHHYSLSTGALTAYTPPSYCVRQTALRWDDAIFNVGNSVRLYNNNGTFAAAASTITSTTSQWPWVGFAGDASEAFRPKSDFGDAPLSYDPVALGVATHEYNPNLILGTVFDREWNKTVSANATADGADEDGIVTPMLSFTNTQTTYTFNVSVLNNTGAAATLAGWIDLDNDGSYETGEGVTVTVNSNAAQQTITLTWTGFPVITNTTTNVFVRLRLTSQTNGMATANATGYYSNGEVEDHLIPVNNLLPNQHQIKLNASVDGQQVKLSWLVNNQVGIGSYIVERSADGIVWNTLREVKASIMNADAQMQYAETDEYPFRGVSYYRVKEVYNNQAFLYSNINRMEIKGNYQVAVTPNPFQNNLAVTVSSSVKEEINIRLHDASGRVLYSTTQTITAGQNKIIVDRTASLPAGVYYISIWSRSFKTEWQKIIKQ
jgi:hypothetical protein